MASDFKQQIYQTIVSVISTDANSLANNAYLTSSAFGDDTTNAKQLMGDLELVLNTLNPTGTPLVDVWIIRSADGTNYPTAVAPPAMKFFVGSFELTTGSSTKYDVIPDVVLPPGLAKIVIRNRSGVSFASSGNTVKYRPHSYLIT